MRIQEQSTGRWKTVLSSSWLKISDILKCPDTRSLILLAGNIIWFGLWCDTSTMLIMIKAVMHTVVILVLRLYISMWTVIIVVPLPRIATIKLWQCENTRTEHWTLKNSAEQFLIEDIWHLVCLDTRSLILLAGNIIWFGLWCDTSTMLILIKAVTHTVVILVLRLYIFHVQPTGHRMILPRIATIKLWQWSRNTRTEHWTLKNSAQQFLIEDIWHLEMPGHSKFDFVSW